MQYLASIFNSSRNGTEYLKSQTNSGSVDDQRVNRPVIDTVWSVHP